MASTDLKLDAPGTLPRPGPIGRLVRLLLGYACLHYVYELCVVWDAITLADGSVQPLLWNGIVIGLFLISYIINIGFSRDWKKWPVAASLLLLLVAAGINYTLYGAVEGEAGTRLIHVWLLYTFTHLGLCFVIAAVIATPGCEMRALHHLYSRITGRPTREHHCPVGPLQAVDHWESGR